MQNCRPHGADSSCCKHGCSVLDVTNALKDWKSQLCLSKFFSALIFVTLQTGGLHGNKDYTQAHPSPQTAFPSPRIPIQSIPWSIPPIVAEVPFNLNPSSQQFFPSPFHPHLYSSHAVGLICNENIGLCWLCSKAVHISKIRVGLFTFSWYSCTINVTHRCIPTRIFERKVPQHLFPSSRELHVGIPRVPRDSRQILILCRSLL